MLLCYLRHGLVHDYVTLVVYAHYDPLEGTVVFGQDFSTLADVLLKEELTGLLWIHL